MVQIDDVVVSLDTLRERFICNLDAYKGEYRIEGGAEVPIELEGVEKLEEVLPIVWGKSSPEARVAIDKQGVAYTNPDGDLVTSTVDRKDCALTCYDEKGHCHCAIEKAYRKGEVNSHKPVPCHLYPIRVGNYRSYKAVNYHRWDVCKVAVSLGRKENMPVYRFPGEPSIRKLGQEWYDELEIVVKELQDRGMI